MRPGPWATHGVGKAARPSGPLRVQMGPVGFEPTTSTYPIRDCKGGVICGPSSGKPLDHGPLKG